MDSDSALRKSRRLEMMESWAGVRPGWVGGPRVPKRGGLQGEDIRVGARRGRDSPGIETSLGVSASGAPLPPHGQKPRDEWDSGTRPAHGRFTVPCNPSHRWGADDTTFCT